MSQSLSRYAVILLAGIGACNREQPKTGTQAAPGSAVGDPSVVHHSEPPQRLPEKIDSILVEGSYERFRAQLVQPHSSLPFSTYIPAHMLFESASSGEGEGFYFFTNFAGVRNENAFLLVFLLPPDATESDAQRLVGAFLASRTTPRSFTRAEIGRHDERYYYIAQHYPHEYGDGFGPRAEYIRKEWVWLSDGSGLVATSQLPRESPR